MADAPKAQHLTGPYQIIEGFHRFLYRRFIVEAVDDVKVEIIRPQPLQTAVNLAKNRLAGQAAVVEIDLRGDDGLVPGDVLLQRPT